MTANLRKMTTDLSRQPLVHFVVLGLAVAAAVGWLWDRDDDRADTTIRVSAADISRMEAEWQARWNRAPTTAELDGLIKARIREEVLYREALAIGLDEDDVIIRRVLGQKLERMVKDLVELSLAPADEDLEAYFAEHAERYRRPSLITFTHVFVDPDKREEQTIPDAEEILERLRSLERPTEGIDGLGDRFMLQAYYPEKDEQRIASLFGRPFARSLFELPPGAWHGPVLSGYGTHLVYVVDRTESPLPDLGEVRNRVTQDWIDDNREQITDRYYADLLARYEAIVERDTVAGDDKRPIAANTP